ncbi:MAG: hypothetical protein QOH56_1251 [Pseudonocardiales bacterium]|nr:hypothetical protein [Pseudonocardiales bacterium]
MTSNRSLTEELQSVLRAHSLNAPEPSGAIEDILARTIAADSSDEQPSPRSRPRVLRLLLRPAIVGVAASVAFVLVGVAVVNATRDNGSGGSTASLSEGSPATVQQNRAGAADKSVSGDSPVASAVAECARPSDRVSSSTAGPLTVPRTGARMTVAVTTCTDGRGVATGSQVDVVSQTGSLLATLVDRARAIQADFVIIEGARITVRGYSARLGGAFDYPFTMSPDGTVFTAGPAQRYASNCVADNVRVSIKDGPVRDRTQLVQVVNTDIYPCALAGYPTVTALSGSTTRAVASATIAGPSGGVSGSVAPVVVLTPGAVATSLVELDSQTDGTGVCPASDRVRVSIGAPPRTVTIPLKLPVCGLQVHPLVPGETGSN